MHFAVHVPYAFSWKPISKTSELYIETTTNFLDEVNYDCLSCFTLPFDFCDVTCQGICNSLPEGELPLCNVTQRHRPGKPWHIAWEYVGEVLWETPIPNNTVSDYMAKLHHLYWQITNQEEP